MINRKKGDFVGAQRITFILFINRNKHHLFYEASLKPAPTARLNLLLLCGPLIFCISFIAFSISCFPFHWEVLSALRAQVEAPWGQALHTVHLAVPAALASSLFVQQTLTICTYYEIKYAHNTMPAAEQRDNLQDSYWDLVSPRWALRWSLVGGAK